VSKDAEARRPVQAAGSGLLGPDGQGLGLPAAEHVEPTQDHPFAEGPGTDLEFGQAQRPHGCFGDQCAGHKLMRPARADAVELGEVARRHTADERDELTQSRDGEDTPDP
jgi:hypothetical protein